MIEDSGQDEGFAIKAHIFMRDMARATHFYEELGFTLKFLHGKPPFYGEVYKDRACLALRLVCEPIFVGDVRSRQELLSATIVLPSPACVKNFYAFCADAGLSFHRNLADQTWSTSEFVIVDPDNNLICLSAFL